MEVKTSKLKNKILFLTLLPLVAFPILLGIRSLLIVRGQPVSVMWVTAPETITAPDILSFNVSVWLSSLDPINVSLYQVTMDVDDTVLGISRAWNPETNSSWIFLGEITIPVDPSLTDDDDDGWDESVKLGSSLLGVNYKSVTDSVLLAVIELKVRDVGTTVLNISRKDAGVTQTFILDMSSDPWGVELDVEKQDGQVRVEGYVPTETSTITMEFSPSIAVAGQNVTIKGEITPDKPGVDVTIDQKYEYMGGEVQETVATVKTNQTSQYEYIHSFSEFGTYKLRASWTGDQTHLGDNTGWIEYRVKEITVEVEIVIGLINPNTGEPFEAIGSEVATLPTEEVPMNVTVKNATDLHSWRMKIYYDPDVVEINIIPLPADNVLNLTGHAYNTTSDLGDDDHGYYLFCEAKINNQTVEGFTGNGTLFQFNVVGLAQTIPGTTDLEVQECSLTNSTGHPILYGWGALTSDGIFSLAIFGAFSTMITVINPVTGDGAFIFYSDEVSVGDLFNVTIRIVEAVDLYGCLFELVYNSTLMNITRVIQPVDDSEYVFYNKNSAIDIVLEEGFVSVNNTLTEGEPFEGDGLMIIIEFEILVVATEEAIVDFLTLGGTKVYNLVRWRAITSESGDYIFRVGEIIEDGEGRSWLEDYWPYLVGVIIVVVIVYVGFRKLRKEPEVPT